MMATIFMSLVPALSAAIILSLASRNFEWKDFVTNGEVAIFCVGLLSTSILLTAKELRSPFAHRQLFSLLGLGGVILAIVDLFCGSSSVAWFAAQQLPAPVLASDLQQYSVVLARAVLGRTAPLAMERVVRAWRSRAAEWRKGKSAWRDAVSLDDSAINIRTWSKYAKELCSVRNPRNAPVWNSYGGYYFSPTQAFTFDSLLATLPTREPSKSACHASLIIAASKCAASPGHTAQPFKATISAGPFLREAWLRDPLGYVEKAATEVFSLYSQTRGHAEVRDALLQVQFLSENDLVFVDPPYSGVHYSRFYHVLETIAIKGCSPVSGEGRYPPIEERPSSEFSQTAKSKQAFERLICALSKKGTTVILTFPAGTCSNGISGREVEEICCNSFSLSKKVVKTRFSTLGGNNSNRSARQLSDELILLLEPK